IAKPHTIVVFTPHAPMPCVSSHMSATRVHKTKGSVRRKAIHQRLPAGEKTGPAIMSVMPRLLNGAVAIHRDGAAGAELRAIVTTAPCRARRRDYGFPRGRSCAAGCRDVRAEHNAADR